MIAEIVVRDFFSKNLSVHAQNLRLIAFKAGSFSLLQGMQTPPGSVKV